MRINPRNSEFGIRNSTFQNAFTMIEIAIALAVIAFALVAIIGVLPTGLNVQKDNREDTIINQDGPYWLEAVRNGAQGLDHLTNFVQRIGVVVVDLGTNFSSIQTNYSFYDNPLNQKGSNIIGLLSMERGGFFVTGSTTQLVLRVEAQVRALTGSAVEQGLVNTNFAFSYLLTSEIAPFHRFQVDSTNFVSYATNTFDYISRSNRWVETRYLSQNNFDVRLNFRWPLLPNGNPGPNRQLFRTLIAGELAPAPDNLRFFQPQTYVQQ